MKAIFSRGVKMYKLSHKFIVDIINIIIIYRVPIQNYVLSSSSIWIQNPFEFVPPQYHAGRAWLAQLVSSLPSNHRVPSSIPGFAEIWIFVRPSFPPKPTQLSILPLHPSLLENLVILRTRANTIFTKKLIKILRNMIKSKFK